MSDIKTILDAIQGAIDKLSENTGGRQKQLYKKLVTLISDLEKNGDDLLNNLENFKKIAFIKAQLEKVITSKEYLQDVKHFVQAYDQIAQLNMDYFSKFNTVYHPSKTLDVIKEVAIKTTLNNLLEAGLSVGVIEPIRKVLFNNTTTGGSYSDLTEQLRSLVLGDDKKIGILDAHIRTVSTTSINQYSAEYHKTVSDDLGLHWFVYTGSLLTTSRAFCIKCVDKKYVHESEFNAILKGDFGGLGKVPINKSTGLPSGLMAGTDPENFPRRRGGWSCGHQLIAVNEIIVPQSVKDTIYATGAYHAWKGMKGNKS